MFKVSGSTGKIPVLVLTRTRVQVGRIYSVVLSSRLGWAELAQPTCVPLPMETEEKMQLGFCISLNLKLCLRVLIFFQSLWSTGVSLGINVLAVLVLRKTCSRLSFLRVFSGLVVCSR